VTAAGILPKVLPLLPLAGRVPGKSTVQRLYSLVVAKAGQDDRLRRLHILYADGERIARNTELDHVLAALETDLHRYVAETSPGHDISACRRCRWQGRAILLPGRSLSGKTTLVRELLRRGATYYSDEFAVVDDFGNIHPFPRPLGSAKIPLLRRLNTPRQHWVQPLASNR